jgi:hypothetical protein
MELFQSFGRFVVSLITISDSVTLLKANGRRVEHRRLGEGWAARGRRALLRRDAGGTRDRLSLPARERVNVVTVPAGGAGPSTPPTSFVLRLLFFRRAYCSPTSSGIRIALIICVKNVIVTRALLQRRGTESKPLEAFPLHRLGCKGVSFTERPNSPINPRHVHCIRMGNEAVLVHWRSKPQRRRHPTRETGLHLIRAVRNGSRIERWGNGEA